MGSGDVRWEPRPEWNYVADVAFWRVHGELMRELGLDDGRRRSPAGEDDAAGIAQLVDSLPLIGLAASRDPEGGRREGVRDRTVEP